MRKKLFLLFPTVSNRGRIATAIPILGGIAREQGWDVTYADTAFYQKEDDSFMNREKTGGLRPGPKETIPDAIPAERLVPNLQSQIDKLNPAVIAITATTSDYQYLMTFFPQIKISAGTVVVIGGVHATAQEKEVLDTGLFDLVCYGQGEETFSDILSRIGKGERIDNIEGTSFRDKKTGRIVQNPRRKLLPAEKLWEVEPEYSYFDERYFHYPFYGKTVNMFWVDLGRGCPYACTYCGNTLLKESYKGLGDYIVTRPIDSAFRLFKKMVDQYKVDVFNITHECFLSISTAWLEEFVERWAKEVNKIFLMTTRAETVKEEKLKILKKSGASVIQIGLGVESGSERILREICNRRVRNETTVNAFKLLKKHDFRTNALYMVGFPTETREEIFETIVICKKIDADVDAVSIFQPFPGQPLTKLCIEKGYLTGKEKIPSFTEGSILKMPQILAAEIANLRRVFLLYAKLPKEYWPDVEKCEKDYESNKDLFDKLVELRWELADNKVQS